MISLEICLSCPVGLANVLDQNWVEGLSNGGVISFIDNNALHWCKYDLDRYHDDDYHDDDYHDDGNDDDNDDDDKRADVMSPCRENHGSLSPLRHQLLSITLHCWQLQNNALHYISLQYIKFQYITLEDNAHGTNSCQLHYIAGNYKITHYITLHCCRLHFNTWQYISIHLIGKQCTRHKLLSITFRYIAVSTLHCSVFTLHCAVSIGTFHCSAVGRLHCVTLNCAFGIVCSAMLSTQYESA